MSSHGTTFSMIHLTLTVKLAKARRRKTRFRNNYQLKVLYFYLWPGTTPPRVPEPADDCITKNVITILPYKVWKELAIKLDPERPLGGDYKDLACEMGYTVEKILYFQSRNGPTEALLTDCANSVSIDELCNKLEAIGRSDARIVVDEWIKKKTANVQLAIFQPTTGLNPWKKGRFRKKYLTDSEQSANSITHWFSKLGRHCLRRRLNDLSFSSLSNSAVLVPKFAIIIRKLPLFREYLFKKTSIQQT